MGDDLPAESRGQSRGQGSRITKEAFEELLARGHAGIEGATDPGEGSTRPLDRGE